jgi:hypothetical protein
LMLSELRRLGYLGMKHIKQNKMTIEEKKELLTMFINEIMGNTEYHILENDEIVEKYLKENE